MRDALTKLGADTQCLPRGDMTLGRDMSASEIQDVAAMITAQVGGA